MKQFFILYIFFLLFAPSGNGQNGNYPVGSRSAALGHASVAFSDVYAATHNQAGLAFLEEFSAGIYAENKFLVEGVNLFGLVAALPTKTGTFSLSTTYFGDELYSEIKLGAGFGKALTEKFALGVQLDYFSTNMSEYGNISAFTAEVGVQYILSPSLTIGAHVFNPVQSDIGEMEEPLPVIFRIGGAWEASEKVMMDVEVEKDLAFDPNVKAGLEYILTPNFHLRAGINTFPVSYALGAGFLFSNMSLDITAIYHQVLGITPALGITYRPQVR